LEVTEELLLDREKSLATIAFCRQVMLCLGKNNSPEYISYQQISLSANMPRILNNSQGEMNGQAKNGVKIKIFCTNN